MSADWKGEIRHERDPATGDLIVSIIIPRERFAMLSQSWLTAQETADYIADGVRTALLRLAEMEALAQCAVVNVEAHFMHGAPVAKPPIGLLSKP